MANFKDIDKWAIWEYFEEKIWDKLTNKPLAASSKGWTDWNNSAKQKYPIRYWIFEEFPMKWHDLFKWSNDLYWQFQWRFNQKHQYNKVTFAKPGYYDTDRRIFYAMCELTTQFVEYQLKDGHVDWDGTPEHRKAWDTMVEVHQYWLNEFPNREEEYPEYPSFAEKFGLLNLDKSNWTEQQHIDYDYWFNRYNFIEEKHLKREEEIIQKIISIRKFMWD